MAEREQHQPSSRRSIRSVASKKRSALDASNQVHISLRPRSAESPSLELVVGAEQLKKKSKPDEIRSSDADGEKVPPVPAPVRPVSLSEIQVCFAVVAGVDTLAHKLMVYGKHDFFSLNDQG